MSSSEHSTVTFVQNFLAHLLVVPPVNFIPTVFLLLDQRSHGRVHSISAGLRGRCCGSGRPDGCCGGGGGSGCLFRFALFLTFRMCFPESLILTLSTVRSLISIGGFLTFFAHRDTFLGNLRI